MFDSDGGGGHRGDGVDDDGGGVAEWLLEAYRTQWLAMLQVDSGQDFGSVDCITVYLVFLSCLLLLAAFDLLFVASTILFTRFMDWLIISHCSMRPSNTSFCFV